MNQPSVPNLLQEFQRSASTHPRDIQPSDVIRSVSLASPDQIQELLVALNEQDGVLTAQLSAGSAHWLVHACKGLSQRAAEGSQAANAPLDVDLIAGLHKHLGQEFAARCELLALLARQATTDSLRTFAELVVTDPPLDSSQVAIAFAPLFHKSLYDVDALFPRLLDGLHHSAAGVVIVDLANFLTRQGRVAAHPATARLAEVKSMLMALTAELGRLEQLPVTDRSPRELSVQVDQCVAYAVSLCDALALIGSPSAIGLLHATMELKHRRLRCEAAAALAALGDEHGKATLLAMAADPVSRLRVVAYAKELGLTQRVAPEYRRPDALAAAELALFLAQPTQIGIPPAACELVDRRELFWPGFEEPVECFLLRYTYRLGDREFSNIGIVGPLTHALAADLQDLPVDDIYACFAGWQAEHEEIVQHDVSQLAPAQRVEVDRLQRKAHDRGFDSIQPLKLARFFGEKVLVATANREGHPGVIVVDQSDVHWFHATATSRPYGPVEAYNIFKGRRLLRSFNE